MKRSDYGRARRRRTLAYYNEYPRQFEADLAAHDRAELDRHDREQQAREPRPDVRVYEEDFLQ